jgi:hypothetical protein
VTGEDLANSLSSLKKRGIDTGLEIGEKTISLKLTGFPPGNPERTIELPRTLTITPTV